jgi:hypothetical protein
MKAAGQLATDSGTPASVTFAGGKATLAVTLPREAVDLVTVEWP